ncbi:TBC1 domain family member 25-like isoform X2 [Stylophora pistillata]|uniref:TBC1 domain family member 25-like isoform X2 n=1 Tax=Stylophora pistillata TaxID=50429 RepID=UPI000C053F52|nr:TBC1 domain family member 25-like isoform X2 [Stylophora pistillata]
MSSFPGNALQDREAIRVKAVVCVKVRRLWCKILHDGKHEGEGVKRCFSVDPHITSFYNLCQLLTRAFQLQGDFEISYQLPQSTENGKRPDVFISLTSDFDLDAAFMSSSLPYLSLKVEPVICSDTQNDWTFLEATEAPLTNNVQSTGVSSTVPFHISLKHQMERTFSKITKAFTDSVRRGPLKESEWQCHLDPEGRVLAIEEIWVRVFQGGGLEPVLRKEVWPHLLNVFPPDLTKEERERHLNMKSQVYYHLKSKWKRKCPLEIESITHLIMKDVLRTDRTHPYFAVPDDHEHMDYLFNILTTYALENPDVSYAQGMSDLAAPILVILDDEAAAYTCFCSLMERIKGHFLLDGKAMTLKFDHLSQLVNRMEPEFFKYLMEIGADDMFFCYRWLLLDLKREFQFDDAVQLMEVIWSSLTLPTESTARASNMVSGLPRSNSAAAILTQKGFHTVNNSNDSEDEWDSDLEDNGFYPFTSKSVDVEMKLIELPGPYHLGGGNPFVLFLCLAILSLHKDHCMNKEMDYNTLAMYFDKLVRKHDLHKTLTKARALYSDYLSSCGFEKDEETPILEETNSSWCSQEHHTDVFLQANHFVEC